LYAAQGDIEDRFGVANVAAWSQTGGAAAANGLPLADVGRIQRSLDASDAEIDGLMQDGPYIVPLAAGADAAIVTNWSATLAGVWLYQTRGLRDDTRDGNKYTALRAGILLEMQQYKSGVKRLRAARRWPTTTAPMGVA
jgi:phage gp36-like protein